MSTLGIFRRAAATSKTGYEVEQELYNKGYREIGRRTYASAWSLPDDDKIIRISADADGSYEFYALAQKLEGNPYLPVVYGQEILPSGDHIACVEKLESFASDLSINRFRRIHNAAKAGEPVTETDMQWMNMVDTAFQSSMVPISNIFLKAHYTPDIDETFVNPEAFRSASVAVLELGVSMHEKDRRFFPGVDMNPSNILFRETAEGLQPVINDTLKRPYGSDELPAVDAVRQKFGLPELGRS